MWLSQFIASFHGLEFAPGMTELFTAPDEHLARFTLSAFRPGQRDVIEAVFAGKDCVCIMPTGGGKSLCYQLPAIARAGVALVVSPLIALMKDQVDGLISLGLRASFINSSLPPDEQHDRIARMQSGELDLVYVAPERFRSRRFVQALAATKIQLLAVDEAHCISEWGHDFRPDYARLGQYRRQLGSPQTIALTATATPDVREDIVRQLGLDSPRTFMAGFARPNLHYEVTTVGGAKDKDAVLLDFLNDTPGSGIIYVSARKRCEEVAETVARTGRRVGIYHAGLMPDQRRQAQEDFMRGKVEVVIATVAFGMGIDKADVRFVVHYNMPGSIESYYQEAGRAGRDGQPARCLLIYAPGDRYTQQFFIESSYPSPDVVHRVYDFLRELDADPIELTQQEIKTRLQLDVGAEGVGACFQLLEKAAALERLEPMENRAIVRLNTDTVHLVDLLPATAKVQRKVLSALEQLVGDERFEDVYFHPRSLPPRLELDSAAVARALRELQKLECFDYVPPFRGRAVRILQPQREFGQLEIDWETYQKRKDSEYEKLDHIIRYAKSRGCRQLEILHYFGDMSTTKCGHCDRCDQSQQPGSTTATPQPTSAQHADLLRTVRIALSGVARTDGRFGKQVIAQMLGGSKSSKLAKFKLDRLSTFNLLGHLRQSDIVTLLESLVEAGLVEQFEIDRYRPIMRLTELGTEVMLERSPLGELHLPSGLLNLLCHRTPQSPQRQNQNDQQSAAADAATEELPPIDSELLDRLRQWRNERAAALGWPLYLVLSNAVLDKLSRYRPASRPALEGINGIGPAKLDMFGEEILQLTAGSEQAVVAPQNDHDEPSADAEPWDDLPAEPDDYFTASSTDVADRRNADAPRSQQLRVDAAEALRPGYFWTWRLLFDGYTVEECAQIRGLDADEVFDHALQAAENGLQIEPAWVFTKQQLDQLQQAVRSVDSEDQLRPTADALPDDLHDTHVQLFLKCQQGK